MHGSYEIDRREQRSSKNSQTQAEIARAEVVLRQFDEERTRPRVLFLKIFQCSVLSYPVIHRCFRFSVLDDDRRQPLRQLDGVVVLHVRECSGRRWRGPDQANLLQQSSEPRMARQQLTHRRRGVEDLVNADLSEISALLPAPYLPRRLDLIDEYFA